MVVSRQWHGPEIRVSVDETGISVTMMLPDFLRALVTEMQLKPEALPHLTAAAERVVAEMQESTARVM
jgi:hypothetical protein